MNNCFVKRDLVLIIVKDRIMNRLWAYSKEKHIQTYLMLLHFTVLCFAEGAFCINQKQDPPPAKGLQLSLLQCSPYYRGLDLNLQYLRGMPVFVMMHSYKADSPWQPQICSGGRRWLDFSTDEIIRIAVVKRQRDQGVVFELEK